MHARASTLLAAAALGGGVAAMLTGCADQPAAPAESAPSSVPSVSPSDDPSDAVEGSGAPAVTERVPLGFEVRYVDENGRFVTVRPEDFPR